MKREKRPRIKPGIVILSTIVFFAIFTIYLWMLPAQYTDANYGADGGDLLAAVLTGGVPHPSGYPTYLLISEFFQILPFNTTYYRGALLSAFFSALAAGMTCLTTWLSLGRSGNTPKQFEIPVVVGIALGISPLFWSQAVIVEVYGLASFFFVCALIWIILILNQRPENKTDYALLLLSILIGLGLGNHLLLGLIAPAMIFASISYLKNRNTLIELIKYHLLIAMFAIGIYILIPLRARTNPPINWGDASNLEGILWLLSGKPYQGLAFSIPTSEIIDRIQFTAKLLMTQFGIFGLFIGSLGIVRIFSTKKEIKWVLLWVVIVYSIFSIGYLTNDSLVYLIPVFIVFAIFIGNGILELATKIGKGNQQPALILSILFLIPLIIRFPNIWTQLDPREEDSARIHAQKCLEELPGNAILLTNEDTDTFPAWYFHFGLGIRPDISVVSKPLLQYEWYKNVIGYTYPEINISPISADDFIQQMILSNPGRRVCNSVSSGEFKDSWLCSCN